MKNILIFLALLLLLQIFSYNLIAQCPTGNVYLQSQADIDDFVATYPDYPRNNFWTGGTRKRNNSSNWSKNRVPITKVIVIIDESTNCVIVQSTINALASNLINIGELTIETNASI